MFIPSLATGRLDENALHCLSGCCEKMAAAVRVSFALVAEQRR